MNKVIGIDFDNTLVCYGDAFYLEAMKDKIVPREILRSKEAIRDYLRGIGKESLFLEMQGNIYGPGIMKATPFEGAREFIIYSNKMGFKVKIISHKTKTPVKCSAQHDLHNFAYQWLARNKFFDNETGLKPEDVFFELTREDKIKRISAEKCAYFIDDLPEVFSEISFPNITKILFNPNRRDNSDNKGLVVVKDWTEVRRAVHG